MGTQMSRVAPGGDRGLQVERTRLAWRRTTLITTVVALLALTRVVTGGVRPTAVAGLALVALAWLAIVGVAHRRIRTLSAPLASKDGRDQGAPRTPAALALLTVALALVGMVLLS